MDTPTPLVPSQPITPAPQPQAGYHPDASTEAGKARIADRKRDFLNRENADLDGFADQLKNIRQLLERLQKTPGKVNTEDDLLIDSIEAAVSDAITRFNGIVSAPRSSHQVI